MNSPFILTNIIGTIAFAVGVLFIIMELRQRGLTRFSLFSYLFFIASTVFLSPSLTALLVSAAVLSALFLILLIVYRRLIKYGGRK